MGSLWVVGSWWEVAVLSIQEKERRMKRRWSYYVISLKGYRIWRRIRVKTGMWVRTLTVINMTREGTSLGLVTGHGFLRRRSLSDPSNFFLQLSSLSIGYYMFSSSLFSSFSSLLFYPSSHHNILSQISVLEEVIMSSKRMVIKFPCRFHSFISFLFPCYTPNSNTHINNEGISWRWA